MTTSCRSSTQSAPRRGEPKGGRSALDPGHGEAFIDASIPARGPRASSASPTADRASPQDTLDRLLSSEAKSDVPRRSDSPAASAQTTWGEGLGVLFRITRMAFAHPWQVAFAFGGTFVAA